MSEWLHDNLQYLQTTTVMVLVFTLVIMWFLGHLLQRLAHDGHIFSKTAVHIIGTVATLERY
jgi:hypothetical protein